MFRYGILIFAILLTFKSVFAQTPAGALSFDGNTDYVHIANGASFQFSTNFTIEARIRPASGGAFSQSVISTFNASDNSGFQFPATTDNWSSIEVEVYIDGIARRLSAPNFYINSWFHAAVTYDGNYLKLYVNGVLMASAQYQGSINVKTDSLYLGTNLPKTAFYNGRLDEVRIWNRALSDCEIQNNLTCELGLPQNGISAYYRFNQGFVNADNTSIAILADSSGNANNGQLSGFSLSGPNSNWVTGNAQGNCTPVTLVPLNASVEKRIVSVDSTIQLHATGADSYSWTGPNGFTSSSANPVITNAMLTNTGVYYLTSTINGCTSSSSVYVTVAYQAKGLSSLGGAEKISITHQDHLNFRGGFTVEAWIRPTSFSNIRQVVMEKGFSNSGNGFEFIGTDDGWFSVSSKIKVDGVTYSISAPFPGINQWQHVACVYDGSKMMLYLNGVLSAFSAQSISLPQPGEPLTLFNNAGANEGFIGGMDEVRIWNRPLNACEINTRKQNEISAIYDNLVAYYRFNQGFINVSNAVQSVLTDTTVNQNDGILTGFRLEGLNSNWTDGKYINNVSGGNSYSLPEGYASVTQSINYLQHETNNCTLVARIIGSGSNPISGDCTSKVWVESSNINHSGNTFAKRHYQLTPSSNESTATGIVTLYFTQSEFDYYNNNVGNSVFLPTSPSDNYGKSLLRIAKYSGSSNDGSGLPPTYSSEVQFINPADDSIVWNAAAAVWEVTFSVEGFSGFFIQASLQALPLTWVDFQLTNHQKGILLNWETADEINTLSFLIEHRVPPSNWIQVGTIKSSGKSNQRNSYSFFHPNTLAGINQYRIKQTDLDGIFTYSAIKTIKTTSGNLRLRLLSNPVTNGVLKINAAVRGTINIYTADGKLLRKLELNAGVHHVSFDDAPSGTYYLLAEDLIIRFLKIN